MSFSSRDLYLGVTTFEFDKVLGQSVRHEKPGKIPPFFENICEKSERKNIILTGSKINHCSYRWRLSGYRSGLI
jgi:hypothetical protein